MTNQGGRYTDEYRKRMVDRVRAGRSPKSLAREFHPVEATIRSWVRQAQREEGWKHNAEAAEEIRRLRMENRRLHMEVHLLRRAAHWSKVRFREDPEED